MALSAATCLLPLLLPVSKESFETTSIKRTVTGLASVGQGWILMDVTPQKGRKPNK
jgi:hypothetical protein